jgi:hypothetical protein
MVKASLLLFYRRIFTNFKFRILVDILLGFTALFGVAFAIFYLVQCRPLSYYWNRFEPGAKGHCVDAETALIVIGVCSATLDVLVLVLPIRICFTLSYPFRQKLLVVALFTVGVLACVAGGIRTWFLHYALTDTRSPETWSTITFWSLATVEVYLGIICACLPGVRALINAMRSSRENFALKQLSGTNDMTRTGFQQVYSDNRNDVSGHTWYGDEPSTQNGIMKSSTMTVSWETLPSRADVEDLRSDARLWR